MNISKESNMQMKKGYVSINDERAIFFAKGVVETVKKLNWVPDIIHVHGWMAAMLPIT
jgi:glycogen synthase